MSSLPFDNSPHLFAFNKPAGMSSFDLIRKIRPTLFKFLGRGKGRRKLKIGHFGTLDPFADGLLLVGTGKAMKLMNLIQRELPKTYLALGVFGKKTLTGDREGEVIEEVPWDPEKRESFSLSVRESAKKLEGPYWQSPPYFSAVKYEGRCLYEYAREGLFIKRPPVKREIYALEVTQIPDALELPLVEFRAKVSNGTYIRTLWQDMLGDFKNCGHLIKLTREEIGPLHLKDALDIRTFCAADTLLELPLEKILSYKSLYFSKEESLKLLQGQSLKIFDSSRFEGLDSQEYFWAKLAGENIEKTSSLGGSLLGLALFPSPKESGHGGDGQVKLAFNLWPGGGVL